jgi:hypothetical protein
MQDDPATLQLSIAPAGETIPTPKGAALSLLKGIEVIVIAAGISNGWIFQSAVLQATQS